jgi:hypothetical protein
MAKPMRWAMPAPRSTSGCSSKRVEICLRRRTVTSARTSAVTRTVLSTWVRCSRSAVAWRERNGHMGSRTRPAMLRRHVGSGSSSPPAGRSPTPPRRYTEPRNAVIPMLRPASRRFSKPRVTRRAKSLSSGAPKIVQISHALAHGLRSDASPSSLPCWPPPSLPPWPYARRSPPAGRPHRATRRSPTARITPLRHGSSLPRVRRRRPSRPRKARRSRPSRSRRGSRSESGVRRTYVLTPPPGPPGRS